MRSVQGPEVEWVIVSCNSMNKGLQHCTTPTAPISIINYPQLGSLCIIHIHLLAQYHWNWTACGLDFYLLEFRAGYCFVEFCWFLVVSRSEKSDSTMCFIHRIVRPLGSSIVDRGLSIESIWKRVQAVWVPPRCRIISQSLSLSGSLYEQIHASAVEPLLIRRKNAEEARV